MNSEEVPMRRNGKRWLALSRLGLALLLAVGAFQVVGLGHASNDDQSNEHWVGTWSNALHQPDLGVPGLSNPGFNNQTLRQIVHVSVGGPWVRVRLSTFGSSALVVGSAHIALGSTASIVPGSDRTLTFGGSPIVTIPPGALVVSDPVELDVPDEGDVAVSTFVPGATGPASWHFEGRQTSCVCIPGALSGPAGMPHRSTTQARL